MYIKYIDYLSPRITFYYKGYLSHSSIFSGLISVIAITFIVILIVYFSLELVQKNYPNTFYFNSFTKDAGSFKVNTSSFFHFVNIVENIRGETKIEFDFTKFNIIGTESYVDNYLNVEKYNGLETIDHWVYGYCDKKRSVDKGLEDLITYEFFEKSACIQKFYNSTEDKYYDIGDPKFAWPEIAHGTLNDNNKIYGLYIQRCNNDTLKKILGDGYFCKSEAEMTNYFRIGSRIMHLYFINNYINVLNYEKPNSRYFYRLETPLNKDQYSNNDINFKPVLVETHDGLILDHKKEMVSYTYDRNDVYIASNSGKNLYIGYCFFLKNIMEYYSRSYKRVQEVISSIGGINQAITIIAIYLNYLYNNFVVLYDTEELLHSSIYIEKKIHKRKSIEMRYLKNKKKDKENKNIGSSKNVIQEKRNINENPKNSQEITNKSNNSMLSKTKNNFITNYDEKKGNSSRHNLSAFNIDINKLTSIKDSIHIRKHINFFNFLCYTITCKKKTNIFNIYENFRIKIMSEEHLIRNHLNIYNLLKVMEKKRHLRRYSYQLKDLIKLL